MTREDTAFTALNAGGFPLVAPPPPRGRSRETVEPTFAVLVAAYNCERSVSEALDSALAQTQAPQEVIVCDDGSLDRTAKVVEAFVPDVTLVRQKNRGEAAARNAALARATTSHVIVLDADDVLEPRCLAAYAEALHARPDLDIVTCDAFLESDGEVFDRYYRQLARFVVDDQRRGVLHQHFVFGLAAIRREPVVALGGWDPSLPGNPDTDLFLRLVLEGSRAGLVYEPLARYRLGEASLSSQRAANMRAMVAIVERAVDHPSLNEEERAFVRADLRTKEKLTRVAELEQALREKSRDARSRALGIARARDLGYPPRVRLEARAAALAPSLARLLLIARERRRGATPLRARVRAL